MEVTRSTEHVTLRPLARIARYYLDLGFYSGRIEFGPSVMTRRLTWALASYLLLVAGLICQQAIDLSRRPLIFSLPYDWRVFVASAIVGVALFAPFTRWFTKRRPRPSWEHVLWAFSFGFFVNLSSNWLWKHLL
jgi:hypothetical protein